MQDSKIDELKKEIEELKTCKEHLLKELNKEATCKAIDLKNHQAREMALVDELAGKNEEIEKLKKEIERFNRYNENLNKVNHYLVIRVTLLESEIESRKKAFNSLKEEMANKYIAVETHYNICKTYEERIDFLNKEYIDKCVCKEHENERLKTEVKEALAKRDYWQNLANKEAADAKKVKLDCEKEMEWQKKKLQEFDYVLTKYRAKIKELENANRFSELVINLIVKE